MASGFKKATVNASDVPGTLSNFPAYVDLSRLGITTLAEAQSVRVYAEEAKTTEWAREIVSATEMWVKIPSLTSTTAIYVDWDGVSSDYGVSDTYGRNAVWSDYEVVWHGGDNTTSTALDSTGNGLDGDKTGANQPATQSSGLFGSEFDFAGSYYIREANAVFDTTSESITYQLWFNVDSLPPNLGILSSVNSNSVNNGTRDKGILLTSAGVLQAQIFDGTSDVSQTASGYVSTGNYYMAHLVYVGNTSVQLFANGSGQSPTATGTSFNHTNAGLQLSFEIGTTVDYIDGVEKEIRFRKDALSANWITTEYNNQSDESGFWGTWSDVTSTFTPKVMFF